MSDNISSIKIKFWSDVCDKEVSKSLTICPILGLKEEQK